MIIKKAHIWNYKSIKEIEIDNLTNFNVFIGPNNSGKSNILEALAFSINNVPNQKPTSRKSILLQPKDRYYYSTEPTIMRIYFEFDLIDLTKKSQEIILNYYKQQNIEKITIYKQFTIDENNSLTVELIFEDETFDRQDSSRFMKNEISSNLEKFKFWIISANRDIKEERFNASYDYSLEPPLSGNFIKNTLLKLKNGSPNEQKLFLEIKEKIMELNLFKGDFETFLQADSVDTGWMIDESITFPISFMGSGTNKIIAIIINLLLAKQKIIAIEEPELNLHSKLQRELYNLIKDQCERMQIFIDTHSPVFIDSNDIQSMYLVKLKSDRENLNRSMTSIKKIENIEDINETIRELGIRKSDIFLNDLILFVEGKSDKAIFETFAKTLEPIIRNIGIDFIDTGGSSIKYFAALLKTFLNLKGFNEFYCILDSDNKKEKKENFLKSIENLKFLSKNELDLVKNKIFVLDKPAIEQYLDFFNSSLVHEIWPLISTEVAEQHFKDNIHKKNKFLVLITLLKIHNLKYNKIEHGKKFAEKMGLKKIDPEIIQIFREVSKIY